MPSPALERFAILPQPDDTACGPTCLHAVYRYFGDEIELGTVLAETPRLEHGGTLGVMLGSHALRRGYRATLFTYNLRVFDPTWFAGDQSGLVERLEARRAAVADPRLAVAVAAYAEFVRLGGRLRLEDLTPELLRKPLRKGLPVLTGLSATFLYREKRELPGGQEDDVRGEPVGHFVVLCGYDKERREVLVADPTRSNPMASHRYAVNIDRALASILLGVLTYDANCLVLEPGGGRAAPAERASRAR